MRKSLVLTAATAVAALALTGCSGPSATTGDKVELEFWHGYTEADGKVLDQLIAEFNASQSEVEITPVTKPWATLLDTALPALAADDGPQLIALPPENIPTFASKGALLPLDDWYDAAGSGADVLVEGAVTTGLVQGEHFGAPLSFTPLSMFYNKALFEAAGVEVPTTWDEWVAAATALTVDQDGDGAPEQYGLALQDNQTVGNGVWMSLLKSGGGDVVTESGDVVIDSEANAATLAFWADAVASHQISPTGLTGVDGDELFKAGKAAMTFAGPWMATIATESGIDYGIAPLPAGPDGIKASALAVDISVTSIATDADVAGIHAFLTWFYQQENMVTWSLASGWPPLSTEVDPSSVSENPVVAALTAQSQYGVALLPGVIPQADVLASLDTVTQKALAGGDISALLEAAQAEIEAALAG
ncbi:MAG: ABC transporter substrate-binding protein [Protaetiibacter sp.]